MSEISRQYNAHTCSLTIVAKVSPLSQWTGQLVLNHLRFQLSFMRDAIAASDITSAPECSPAQAESQTIHGSRIHLDALCQAVEDYLHTFLMTSEQFGDWLPGFSNSAPEDAVNQPSGSVLPVATALPKTKPSASVPSNQDLQLRPAGLFSHELGLGPLANQVSGPTLILSTLELSDLAELLDRYSGEFAAMPTLQRSHLRPVPTWFRIAALMVFAVGVTATMSRFMNFSGTGLRTANQPAAISDYNPSELPAASSDSALEKTEPEKPNRQSPAQKVPKPSASQPTARNKTGLASQPEDSSQPSLPLSPQTKSSPKSTGVASRDPIATTVPRVISGNEELSTERSRTNQPEALRSQRASASDRGERMSQQPIAPGASLSDGLTSSDAAPRRPPSPEIPDAEVPDLDRAASLPKPAPTNQPQPIGGVAASANRSPMNNQVAQPGSARRSAPPLPPPTEEPTFASGTTSTAVSRSPQQPSDLSLQSQPVSPNSGETVPDISLQLAEIRHFFEKTWRPPANLRQSLEYRLFLANDGTLQDRIPLTPLARQYLERIEMPPLRQPFLSPFPPGNQPIVRLILQPDGQVETILEHL